MYRHLYYISLAALNPHLRDQSLISIRTAATMSRYAEAHKNSKGPGDARPTALQIVEDEGFTGKLTDKVFLVTGVSSGIGVETMRALYATGGHVFGTVRNVAKGMSNSLPYLCETDSLGRTESRRPGDGEY